MPYKLFCVGPNVKSVLLGIVTKKSESREIILLGFFLTIPVVEGNVRVIASFTLNCVLDKTCVTVKVPLKLGVLLVPDITTVSPTCKL